MLVAGFGRMRRLPWCGSAWKSARDGFQHEMLEGTARGLTAVDVDHLGEDLGQLLRYLVPIDLVLL